MNFFYLPYQNQSLMGNNSHQFYNYPANRLWNNPMMMNQSLLWPQFNPFIQNSNNFPNTFNYFPVNSFNNIQNYHQIENT